LPLDGLDPETVADSDSSDASDEDEVEPVWDRVDGVYRCPNCNWEIADGICAGPDCFTSFKWNGDEVEVPLSLMLLADNSFNPNVKENINEVAPSLNISLDIGEPNSDRMLELRGTTPLLDIDLSTIYSYRRQGSMDSQFFRLLERGATPLMCETFHLEYSDASGIVAWADGDIYDEFAGPAMLKGDFWKIYLGRRICLDPDDYDGSRFLEAFLEENLLFPINGPPTQSGEPYETVEESPGIWATRPRKPAFHTDEDDSNAEELAEDRDYERYQDYLRLIDRALEIPVDDDGPVHRIDKQYETESDGTTSDEEMDILSVDRAYDRHSNFFTPNSHSEVSSSESDSDSEEFLSGDEEISGWVRRDVTVDHQ
jgi:hypothetical protein